MVYTHLVTIAALFRLLSMKPSQRWREGGVIQFGALMRSLVLIRKVLSSYKSVPISQVNHVYKIGLFMKNYKWVTSIESGSTILPVEWPNTGFSIGRKSIPE